MKPNDLGKKLLVEECQKISVNLLLRKTRNEVKKTLVSSQLEMQGVTVQIASSTTGFGGTRYWFECPICKARIGILYIHPLTQSLGCRGCLGLEYRKRRYKGMIEVSGING